MSLVTDTPNRHDGVDRQVDGFVMPTTSRGLPRRLLSECNPLVPLWHHAEGSYVPAYKGVPVRVVNGAATAPDLTAPIRSLRA